MPDASCASVAPASRCSARACSECTLAIRLARRPRAAAMRAERCRAGGATKREPCHRAAIPRTPDQRAESTANQRTARSTQQPFPNGTRRPRPGKSGSEGGARNEDRRHPRGPVVRANATEARRSTATARAVFEREPHACDRAGGGAECRDRISLCHLTACTRRGRGVAHNIVARTGLVCKRDGISRLRGQRPTGAAQSKHER
jgi:hypothetical protein